MEPRRPNSDIKWIRLQEICDEGHGPKFDRNWELLRKKITRMYDENGPWHIRSQKQKPTC
jgi:hypothetical protein